MVHTQGLAAPNHEKEPVTMTASTPFPVSPIPVALAIAGSDPSGGAGIQADLKTFTAFGVYGTSVITALTAQNTRGVKGVEVISPAFVKAQLSAVMTDIRINAIKTGMLANADLIVAIQRALMSAPQLPLVLDPVMIATSGQSLLQADAVDALRRLLIPRATLVTPNIPEAARLLDVTAATTVDQMIAQAQALRQLGCKAVLLKGGHGTDDTATDILLIGDTVTRIEKPRIETANTHGTGCTLSAAIAALLALGVPLETACIRAKDYVWQALDNARAQSITRDAGAPASPLPTGGKPGSVSHGPVDHLYAIRRHALPA
jgi:hydroxymethylpyrimidine/phosphomethylpyrimidine kinase